MAFGLPPPAQVVDEVRLRFGEVFGAAQRQLAWQSEAYRTAVDRLQEVKCSRHGRSRGCACRTGVGTAHYTVARNASGRRARMGANGCAAGVARNTRTAQRNTPQGTRCAEVLTGYCRGTHRVLVAPRAATLSAPSQCACRTAAGRERPQAQHRAAARGAAGGPVPCYVQYPAVPYRVSATVLGATREWRNEPEASRSMGGHRLPCPYKLAATCRPSLPHPQPRQPRRIGIRHADQLAR